MRGEHTGKPSVEYRLYGSPPHARGALVWVISLIAYFGITPACAGSAPNPV